jgi:hypothetical protein
MKNLVVAAVQIACSDELNANLDKLETHIRSATARDVSTRW